MSTLDLSPSSQGSGSLERDLAVESRVPRGGLAATESGAWNLAVQVAGKRLLDIAGAGLGLIALAPILVVIALLIRVDSKGPILFRQQRLGRGGRPFLVWKFRTMSVDAEARLRELEALNEAPGNVIFKIKRDPRITSIGHFLRRTSLDELPQLFNILRGQMSLVGPRPLPLRDCNLLSRADGEGFERRHRVRPGLTGLWQVSGRSEIGHEGMVELDNAYINDWCMYLDLRILFKTIIVVLTCKGAA